MDFLSLLKAETNVKHLLSSAIRIHVALPQGHRFFPDCLRENYARWIEWAIKVIPSEDIWFVTQTFKRNENLKRALTLNHKWIHRLFQAFEYDKTGLRIRWIRALALQRRGVFHFHLAICSEGLGLLSRKRWEHRWEAMDWNAGTCRIYESDKDLPRYLAREISKEGELSWGGNWQGLNTPGSVRCCDTHAQHAEAIIFRLSKSSSMH
jgi:hypothetical protein